MSDCFQNNCLESAGRKIVHAYPRALPPTLYPSALFRRYVAQFFSPYLGTRKGTTTCLKHNGRHSFRQNNSNRRNCFLGMVEYTSQHTKHTHIHADTYKAKRFKFRSSRKHFCPKAHLANGLLPSLFWKLNPQISRLYLDACLGQTNKHRNTRVLCSVHTCAKCIWCRCWSRMGRLSALFSRKKLTSAKTRLLVDQLKTSCGVFLDPTIRSPNIQEARALKVGRQKTSK